MKITNKHNVPETLVQLTKSSDYRKNADYSVTEIISPPRIQRLRKRYFSRLQTDVSDLLWQMMGTALHNVAEKSEVANHINEERLTLEIDNVTLSGAIDVQSISKKSVKVIDYKFCSVWSVLDIKPDWETQLNIYGWLIHKVKGLDIEGLQICAMLRDWTRSKVKFTQDYPTAPIKMLDIPKWDFKKTEEYVKERIYLHKQSKFLADIGEELPLCTNEERWKKCDKYAVVKTGGKRAVKLFDKKELAEFFAGEKNEKSGGFYVEKRIAEPIRCIGNYCGVAEWCTQYNEEVASNQDGESS